MVFSKHIFSASSVITGILTIALTSSAFSATKKNFDFVVGVDGDFKAAINKAAAFGGSESKHFVIFFPDGNYDIGSLTGDDNQMTTLTAGHLSFIGQSSEKTVIFNRSKNESISTTATLNFKAGDIYMQDITILNKAIYGNEANCGSACRHAAIQQEGDKFIFKNVKLLSGQDTYYTRKKGASRTYWDGGQIEGTVDFICGDGDVFFEGTKLVIRRKDGYLTAAATTTTWGYVFNNAIIDVSSPDINGTFYLGRSWKTAKTVFLNTKMIAQPTSVGWGKNMNSAPQVFGEYNSVDGNGKAVNTSQRKTFFDGSKDNSVATLKTVWSANDASKYTLSNIMGGTDSWTPSTLSKQVDAPKIIQQGANIIWDDNTDAMCWVIFVNGKYKANVTSSSYDVGQIPAGSKIAVRAANSMGGLGPISNELTTTEVDVTYYKVNLTWGIGGTVHMSPSGEKISEGTKISFIAEPFTGWKFTGWTGMDAGTNNKSDTLNITIVKDIELNAQFNATGSSIFQAEDGILTDALWEDKNEGFKGNAYVNFNPSKSSVRIPVFTDAAGEYKAIFTFANGSNTPRNLAISTEQDQSQNVEFEKTASWTTWNTKEINLQLPLGASYITIETINNTDGPNIDQVELVPQKVIPPEINPLTEKIYFPLKKDQKYRASIYSANGALIRQSSHSVNTQGLQPGIYILRIEVPGFTRQERVIRIN